MSNEILKRLVENKDTIFGEINNKLSPRQVREHIHTMYRKVAENVGMTEAEVEGFIHYMNKNFANDFTKVSDDKIYHYANLYLEGKLPNHADPTDVKIKDMTEKDKDEDEEMPEELPDEEDMGEEMPSEEDFGDEPAADEEPSEDTPEAEMPEEIDKEYFGSNGDDTFYYMVSSEEEDQDDIKILDQDGEEVYSALARELDLEDVTAIIVDAVTELEMDSVSYEIIVKYIFPKLKEDDEENEEEVVPAEDEEQAEIPADDEEMPEEDEDIPMESVSKANETKKADKAKKDKDEKAKKAEKEKADKVKKAEKEKAKKAKKNENVITHEIDGKKHSAYIVEKTEAYVKVKVNEKEYKLNSPFAEVYKNENGDITNECMKELIEDFVALNVTSESK